MTAVLQRLLEAQVIDLMFSQIEEVEGAACYQTTQRLSGAPVEEPSACSWDVVGCVMWSLWRWGWWRRWWATGASPQGLPP